MVEVNHDLEESRGLCNKLIEFASDSIFLLNENGTFLSLNDQAARSFGKKKEDLLNKNVKEVFPPKMAENQIAVIKEIYKTKEPVSRFEYYIPTKSGDKYFQTVLTPIIEENKVISVLGIARNLTEKKKVEEALKKSEEKFREIVENINDVIYRVNKKGIVNYVSPSIKKLIGYNPSKIIGQPFGEFIYEEDFLRVMKNVQEISTGKETDNEYRILTKSGDIRWIHTSSRPIMSKGKFVGFQGTLSDITERKFAEEALKKSKEHLDNVINSASDIIFSIDDKGKVTSWNSTAEFVFKYKTKDVLHKNITNLNIFDNIEKIKEIIDEESIVDKDIELTIHTKDKKIKFLRLSVSILEKEDEPAGFVFIGKDITSIKQKIRNIELGNSYLILNQEEPYTLFFDLLPREKAVFIARNINSDLKAILEDKNVHTIVLSRELLPFGSDLKKLYNKIELNICKNCLIYLDRIDYLITLYGFEEFIKFIYDVNDLVAKNSGLLLLSATSNTLDQRHLNLLKTELTLIPEIRPGVDEFELELLEILRFISDNSLKNLVTSFKQVKRKFNISNVTTRKRITALVNLGYVNIIKKGRLKLLTLTNKTSQILK